MSNLEFFDKLATKTSAYLNGGRMFSLDFKVYKKTFNDINAKLNLKLEDKVLDLGAGCGNITYYLASSCREITLADGAKYAMAKARSNLKEYKNIIYSLVDISRSPLPFKDGEFDKIICYSVVHYLSDIKSFKELIIELVRITRPGGKIFIGDIPLSEKYKKNLEERKKNFLKNIFLNLKYYFKKYLTVLIYCLQKINISNVYGISYTKDLINETLSDLCLNYQFLEQDSKLPSANSREDLLIQK